MTKENKNHLIYPDIDPKEIDRNYKKFLRRHNWKYDENAMLLKPIKKSND